MEAARMMSFSHVNVLKAHGVAMINGSPCVVLEMMELGDLRKFVQDFADKKIGRIPSPLIVNLCRQIARGMSYLASRGIIHRDLAARNCLLNKEGIVKVADFGLSCAPNATSTVYEHTEIYEGTHRRQMPVRWMSPESLKRGEYSEKSDVVSFFYFQCPNFVEFLFETVVVWCLDVGIGNRSSPTLPSIDE